MSAHDVAACLYTASEDLWTAHAAVDAALQQVLLADAHHPLVGEYKQMRLAVGALADRTGRTADLAMDSR